MKIVIFLIAVCVFCCLVRGQSIPQRGSSELQSHSNQPKSFIPYKLCEKYEVLLVNATARPKDHSLPHKFNVSVLELLDLGFIIELKRTDNNTGWDLILIVDWVFYTSSDFYPVVIDGKEWTAPRNGFVYYVLTVKDKYNPSQRKCAQLGGNLVVQGVKDKNVLRILEALLPVLIHNEYWIGLNDKSAEGLYVWENGDLLQTSEENWYFGNPNNSNNEDCVVTNWIGTRQWNDLNCFNHFRYSLCERVL